MNVKTASFRFEYQILKKSVNLLQRIEEGDWDFLLNHSSKFKLRLIRLIQLITIHLWQNESEFTTPFPKVKGLIASQIFSYLDQTLTFFTQAIVNMKSQNSNYFGSFEPSIIQIESELMIEFFNIVIDGLDNENILIHSIFRPLLFIQDDSMILIHSNSNNANQIRENYDEISSSSLSSCLFMRLFWIKFFQYQSNLPWNEFKTIFIDFYTSISSTSNKSNNNTKVTPFFDAFDTFQSILLNLDQTNHNIPAPPPSSPYSPWANYKPSPSSLDSRYIELETLLDFCAGHSSLFTAFQEKCDPGVNVFIIGCISEGSIDYQKPTILKGLSGLRITSISCGDQHIAVVGGNGQLFTWGKGQFGRLGHGHESDLNEPTLVSALSEVDVVSASCGFAYTFIVSREGKMYSWGTGGNGRLGHGNELNTFLPMLVRAMEDEKVKSVCTGSVHTVMLTEDGRVFTCGKASYVGHGQRQNTLSPLWLNKFNNQKIIKISVATGGFHTLALTENRQIYTWGHNRVGQLGLFSADMERYDDGGLYLALPAIVPDLPENIIDINAGWGHSTFVTEDGEAFVCGRNVEGQLGTKDPHLLPINERGHRYQPTFVRVEEGDLATRKVLQIVCGGEHTIFYCGNFDLIGVGRSKHGQLGFVSSSTTTTATAPSSYEPPRLIPFFLHEKREILQISCSSSCTMVLAGKRSPSSLKKLCSDIVRIHHDDLFVNNTQEEEQEYFSKKHEEELGQRECEMDIDEGRKRMEIDEEVGGIMTRSDEKASRTVKMEMIPNHLKEMIRSLLV